MEEGETEEAWLERRRRIWSVASTPTPHTPNSTDQPPVTACERRLGNTVELGLVYKQDATNADRPIDICWLRPANNNEREDEYETMMPDGETCSRFDFKTESTKGPAVHSTSYF